MNYYKYLLQKVLQKNKLFLLFNFYFFVGLFVFELLKIFIAKSPTKNKLFLLFNFFVGLFVFELLKIFITKSTTKLKSIYAYI